MTINCIIVDDEPLARKGLQTYSESIDFLEIVGLAKNSMEANMLLKEKKTDLIFLDIEMPLISGMDFLKSLKSPPKVIFTTAYSEYALESFEFDVVDYLVKPISFERFLQSANKAYRLMEESSLRWPESEEEKGDYIFVKVDKELIKIQFSKILFIQGMQNYVHIVTENRTYMTLMPLKKVLQSLPGDQFIQSHKSYVVNLKQVEAIGGNQLVPGKHKIPVSRILKESVLSTVMKNNILKKYGASLFLCSMSHNI